MSSSQPHCNGWATAAGYQLITETMAIRPNCNEWLSRRSGVSNEHPKLYKTVNNTVWWILSLLYHTYCIMVRDLIYTLSFFSVEIWWTIMNHHWYTSMDIQACNVMYVQICTVHFRTVATLYDLIIAIGHNFISRQESLVMISKNR